MDLVTPAKTGGRIHSEIGQILVQIECVLEPDRTPQTLCHSVETNVSRQSCDEYAEVKAEVIPWETAYLPLTGIMFPSRES